MSGRYTSFAILSVAVAISALLHAQQDDGLTPLHRAAAANDRALVERLLAGGADPHATTRLGAYTPLLIAAREGSAGVVQPLLNAGADPNTATSNGTTALMLAAAAGSADTVKLLLDRGAAVNAREPLRGLTPLMFAAAAGRTAAVRLLAARGADLRATTSVVDLSGSRRNIGRSALLEASPTRFEPRMQGRPGVDRQYQLSELVYAQGGLAALHFAARQGDAPTVDALLQAGADVNQVTAGDRSTALLIAAINGQFDLARALLDRGADPNLASENGAAPLYAVLNCEWAPRSLYPQPRAHLNQRAGYLELMTALLDKGADPNARLRKKVWYSGYSFDLSGVDEIGATPFWRAAYASDVDAMKLLVARGGDPAIPTIKPAGRPRTADIERDVQDVSPAPPVPIGGPGIPPIVAAAGTGYGEGFAANSHRYAPAGMLAAVRYLVEELHADVDAADHEGNTALHNAAARGDVEMIRYLVSRGADVHAVNREGRTTADMANGPVQRIQPWPEALSLLETLGAKNNHKCVSC